MTTNHQRVTEGFQILTEVLAPYVARELHAKFDNDWWDQGVLSVLYDKQKRDLPRDPRTSYVRYGSFADMQRR